MINHIGAEAVPTLFIFSPQEKNVFFFMKEKKLRRIGKKKA